MNFGQFNVPAPVNEPVKSYRPNSPERNEIDAELKKLHGSHIDIPMVIGGEAITTGNLGEIRPPHQLNHLLGHYHKGDGSHVQMAIDAALKARDKWLNMPWQDRVGIFVKAAELLAGPYRARMNAATMLGQSKNVYQAEIDAACELIDFFRYNAKYAEMIYREQPMSPPGNWNRMEYRGLEGFVLAITPFNFTSIAGNLPTSAALMGNVVVWKPSDKQTYSALVIMDLLREAGLPDGVINMVHTRGSEVGNVCFNHRDFAGIHFTGSTGVFNNMWGQIGGRMAQYRSYPRIVGETGGKDFVLIHPSADVDVASVALSRGSFEYQGQKCSAASRAYVPKSLWPQLRDKLAADVEGMQMGDVRDHTNFINAVIDEVSFDKITHYIEAAKQNPDCKIIAGGTYDKSEGYFIRPTIIQTQDPYYATMCDELFGPVLTVFVYEDQYWAQTLKLVDDTSPYALTGAIIAQDRRAIVEAEFALRDAAGNFYINDKPTGAVVGQQPFGGARASGTNDKAGSWLNLIRWTSPRSIKETLVPAKDYRYPFMQKD